MRCKSSRFITEPRLEDDILLAEMVSGIQCRRREDGFNCKLTVHDKNRGMGELLSISKLVSALPKSIDIPEPSSFATNQDELDIYLGSSRPCYLSKKTEQLYCLSPKKYVYTDEDGRQEWFYGEEALREWMYHNRDQIPEHYLVEEHDTSRIIEGEKW